MRYVAKIHVLDVMDEIVISGYVVDADTHSNPDHESWEFSYQVTSFGLDDPAEWLLTALGRMLLDSRDPHVVKGNVGAADGGRQTISDVGQERQNRVG